MTVAGIRVPRRDATAFGIIDTADGTRISQFLEKPADPPSVPDDPDASFASMGNYVFTTEVLLDIIQADAASAKSGRDIGGDVIPALVSSGEAFVYDFTTNVVPGETPRDRHYWRDVGTLDSYFASNMDLVDPEPVFNLYNSEWPVHTSTARTLPPAKIVAHGELGSARVANSMVAPGSIITGATVQHSIVSPNVRVEPGAQIENCILFDDVVVGPGAVLKNVIVDKNVVIPRNREIGVDLARDAEEFAISKGGVVAIAKGQEISYT
jgi:glucose-1-phosphate adenylyltransferase